MNVLGESLNGFVGGKIVELKGSEFEAIRKLSLAINDGVRGSFRNAEEPIDFEKFADAFRFISDLADSIEESKIANPEQTLENFGVMITRMVNLKVKPN